MPGDGLKEEGVGIISMLWKVFGLHDGKAGLSVALPYDARDQDWYFSTVGDRTSPSQSKRSLASRRCEWDGSKKRVDRYRST